MNTFLSVGPPDKTGYHPIRSIFQAISLGDDLTISETDGPDQLICNIDLGPVENTLTKTLRLLRELLPIPSLRMELTKRIPAESGLGGGSSDAAGLLRILKANMKHDLPDILMDDVALAVGADVPFFLVGGRAKAEGYGEILTPLYDLPTQHLLIARPEVGVATGPAYRALDAMDRPWRDFPSDSTELYNDFERVSHCECGELAERLQVYGASGALMSGSGSAVFGYFADQATAESAREKLLAEGWKNLWVAHTLDRASCILTTS
ncbi:MAG: 4-(cytidine 5'-diphospho)-2-C-methyl-D-erythritol kinase [Fimbriimonadaceae bacterium]